MADRAPDQILVDLARKSGDDTTAAIKRACSLLIAPEDRFYIALSATAAAAGLAVGFGQMCGQQANEAEDAADALWMILRPIIIAVSGGDDADFRKLLQAAPKGRR